MAATQTEEVMIVAAERLFAEQGIRSVSLRQVLAASGQRNKSAANYHFGNKQGLVEAIFQYRMGPIDARRRAMLAELDEQGRGGQLRDILQVLVVPLSEAVGTGEESFYARFAAQVALSSNLDLLEPPHDEVNQGLMSVAHRLEPHLAHVPVALRSIRIRTALGLALQTFADYETSVSVGAATIPASLLAANVVDMLEAIIRAQVSPPTMESLDAAGLGDQRRSGTLRDPLRRNKQGAPRPYRTRSASTKTLLGRRRPHG